MGFTSSDASTGTGASLCEEYSRHVDLHRVDGPSTAVNVRTAFPTATRCAHFPPTTSVAGASSVATTGTWSLIRLAT
jgi:hypothetical protein